MKVLIACEESQEVCKAFRAKGHEAYSCDIQMCSGGHPEWHICNDVLDIINGNTDFFTCDGKQHTVETWDMIIAHPPCTYLTNVATRHYSLKCTPAEKVVERMKHREESIVFFYADCVGERTKNCSGKPYRAYEYCIQKGRSNNSPIYVFKRTGRLRTVCHKGDVFMAKGAACPTANIYRGQA